MELMNECQVGGKAAYLAAVAAMDAAIALENVRSAVANRASGVAQCWATHALEAAQAASNYSACAEGEAASLPPYGLGENARIIATAALRAANSAQADAMEAVSMAQSITVRA